MTKKFIPVLIIVMVFGFVSCKGISGEFTFYNITGSATYHNHSSGTQLYIVLIVQSHNEVGGFITDWQVNIKSGNTILSSLSLNNHLSNDIVSGSHITPYEYGSVLILTDPMNLHKGRMFDLNNPPDKMDVSVTIRDDKGNTTTLSGSGVFNYSE